MQISHKLLTEPNWLISVILPKLYRLKRTPEYLLAIKRLLDVPRIWNKSMLSLFIVTLCLLLTANAEAFNNPLNEIHRNYNKYRNSGDNAAALRVANNMVEISETEFGAESREMARHLQHLAIVQYALEEFTAAERSYRRSIGILEDRLGLYDQALTKPLTQLGRIYFDTLRYPAAMDAFRRTQHLMHRNDGVYTVKQLEVIDWMTKVDLALSKLDDADIQSRFYYRINQKHYGASSLEVVPAMAKMGHWFRDTGQYHDALRIYREMINVIQNNESGDDREVIKPLSAIAIVLFLKGVCCPEEYQQQVLDILRKDPATDFLEELGAVVILADINLLLNNERRAKELYAEAWSMVAQESQISILGESLFARPVQLGVGKITQMVAAYRSTSTSGDWRYRHPYWESSSGFEMRSAFTLNFSNYGDATLIGNPLPLCDPMIFDLDSKIRIGNLPEFYMDLEFTVNDGGETSNAAIVASNSPRRLERYVLNVLARTRYRPRMVAGITVRTEKVGIRQTFAVSDIDSINSEYAHYIASMVAKRGCNLLFKQDLWQ